MSGEEFFTVTDFDAPTLSMPRLRKTFPRHAATPVSMNESSGRQSSVMNSSRHQVATTRVARDQYWVQSVAMVTFDPAMPFLSRVGTTPQMTPAARA